MPFIPGLLGHAAARKFGGQIGRDISDIVLGGQLIIGGFVTGRPELSALGFGLLNSKFRGADSSGLAAAQGAILRNRLNPKAPVPLVYGSAKLGVIIADIAVDGASDNNEDLYVPTVICHGSRDDLGIASIGKIFFNNQLAINAAEAIQTPYTSSNLAFAKYLGTSTQDIADLTIGGTDLDTVFSEWDKATDDGKGLAGVLFMMTWDRDVYPTSLPIFNMEVKGNFIEDTRSEVSGVNLTFADADPDTIVRASGSFTTDGFVAGDRVEVSGSSNNDGNYTIAVVAALTLTLVAGDALTAEGPAGSITLKRWAHPDNGGDNPAMVLRDYLLSSTYGAGVHVTSSMIDDTSFEAMANYCDESVSNPAGSANRFTVNGWLSTGNTARQNIEIIKGSMRASLIPQGSTLHLFIPRVVSASNITLNADNILGDWDFTVPGADTKINMVRMTYIDPDKEFQADVVQWPEPGATNPYLTADGGLTQERSLDLPLTQNVYTAQQIGMTFLKESRHGIVVSLTANQTALQLEIGDVVKVTHDTPSWTDKLFWVAAMTILPETNVRLTLVEYEISITDNMTFADAGPDTITRASGSWIDDGFVAYDEVTVSGSSNNDGTYIVASVAASVLTLDAAEALTNEGPVSCTVKTSIYGLDSQSTAVADVADNLPRNPNDIADPTGLTLTATEAEGFVTATGQYVARIKVTLTDADDAFVDGYDVEAKRNTDTNYDNYGFFHFGDAEFFVTPVTEGEQWDIRVRSVNKQTGVTGDWVTANVTPAYPAASSTTAITDGWSGSQNAAAPENGDESIGAIGSVAYCNLEDANAIVTAFTIYFDVNATNLPGGENVVLKLDRNDAAGSTSWTEVTVSAAYDNGDNLTDETLSYTGAMGADFDFRVRVIYSFTPDPGELAQIEMHGEDHGTQPGVQYDKITTGIIGGTVPANAVTSGGTLIDAVLASSNVTQHEGDIDHDALTNFVGGEHFLQSAITNVGTLATHLLFTDATYDIGASGATRPRDLFLSRNLTVGGTGTFGGALDINAPTSTFASGSAQFPVGFSVEETTHATSTRAGLLLGGWTIGQSSGGDATKDFLWFDGNVGQTRMTIGVDGKVTINGGAIDVNGVNSTFASGSAQFPTAITLEETTHVTSARTAFLLGDWTIGQDSAGDGTKDFFWFDGNAVATRWKITTSGHFIAAADNTHDIGASGATRPRNLYLSGLAVLGGALTVGGDLTLSAAASQLVPGATSFAVRNNADSADNLLVEDNGDVTVLDDLAAGGGLDVGDTIFITERAAALGDTATKGQLWIKNTDPNELWFTDGDGTDHQVAFV